MNSKIVTKWKPILDQILSPYELEYEILDMIAEYLEKNIAGNPTTQSSEEIINIIKEFKDRLSKEIDIRTDIKNIYYNGTIHRIVYELANGDSVYLESKPLVMKDSNYIKKSKNLFLSISEPSNPIVRKLKIDELKKNI